VDDPIASSEANVEGTLKVLVAARECGVRKVVYASSSSVYGTLRLCQERGEEREIAMASP